MCRIGEFIPQISYLPAMYVFEAARALQGRATRYGRVYQLGAGSGVEPASTEPNQPCYRYTTRLRGLKNQQLPNESYSSRRAPWRQQLLR